MADAPEGARGFLLVCASLTMVAFSIIVMLWITGAFVYHKSIPSGPPCGKQGIYQVYNASSTNLDMVVVCNNGRTYVP